MKHICATLLLLCYNPAPDIDRNFINEITECALQTNATLLEQDRIPINLVVAQSILESDWGRSRFAQQGNNYFGIKAVENEDYILSYSGKKLKAYKTQCESVNDYIHLLSFGEPYKEFKDALIKQWVVDRIDTFAIIKYLYNYAEDENYQNKLTTILQQLERRHYGK